MGIVDISKFLKSQDCYRTIKEKLEIHVHYSIISHLPIRECRMYVYLLYRIVNISQMHPTSWNTCLYLFFCSLAKIPAFRSTPTITKLMAKFQDKPHSQLKGTGYSQKSNLICSLFTQNSTQPVPKQSLLRHLLQQQLDTIA